MGMPLTMAGVDRTYQAPRGVKRAATQRLSLLEGLTNPLLERVAGGSLTAWNLFALEHQPEMNEWATQTLDSLIAAADSVGTAALGCTDCLDTGFYGVPDSTDEDLLIALVRRVDSNGYEALTAAGQWVPWSTSRTLEVLSLDLAGDLAAAITGGACGLLRRYAWPRAFLPPCGVVAAAPIREALMSLVSAQPPENTESKWVNFAIVDDADPGAVLELFRVTEGAMERYEAGSWVKDLDFQELAASDLPAVRLDDDQYGDVLAQMTAALVADAPLTVSPDPRAEKLRRYWSVGRGGAKIRWNTPGDWKRCYRHLQKYMGVRARGWCQNMHKRNDGVWTGDRRNPGGNGHRRKGILSSTPAHVLSVGDRFQVTGPEAVSYEACVVDLETVRNGSDPQLVRNTVNQLVTAFDADDCVAVVLDRRSPNPVPTVRIDGEGRRVEQTLGDGATVSANQSPFGMILAPVLEEMARAQTVLSHPVHAAILAAFRSNPGRVHRATAARVTVLLPASIVSAAESSGNNRVTWALVNDTGSHSFHNTRLSPELSLLASVRTGRWGRDKERNPGMPLEMELLTDGIYVEGTTENEGIQRTITAGGFPVAPPDDWFKNPNLSGPTPMEVTDQGQVYGHFATWRETHVGLKTPTPPPHSASDYAYYLTGSLKLESGAKVNVGQITLAGGHADINGNAQAAVQHYDDTNSAIADVTVGEDAYGIWAAGALRPSVTPEQVRVFYASPPSGDWRPINGHLEMVACCSVNVPGFMNVRPTARVAGGAVLALVAAGTSELLRIRRSQDADAALLERVTSIEAKLAEFAAAELAVVDLPVAAAVEAGTPAEAPTAAVEPAAPTGEPEGNSEVEVEASELTPEEEARAAKIAKTREEVAAIKRQMMRDRVHAPAPTTAGLPPQFMKGKDKEKSTVSGTDSFPIGNVADLKKAIMAIGRAKDPEAAKKHIKSMAMKLHRPDLIPSSWSAKASK